MVKEDKKQVPSQEPARKKFGADLLHDPLLNKGTAFTREERARLGILGLLPPAVSSPEQQATRVMANVRGRPTDIDRYIDLLSLLDRNTTLFYKVVTENIEELMPIIYTPTVGQGCQQYAHAFRRSRGVFLSRREKGMFREVFRNWPHRDVRVIVVTDGERILGLGDLGCNGMGIPVGKLSLYTACGGVPPEQTLPVVLDVGTNNEALLADPLYLGLRERRSTGGDYDELADEFIQAVQEEFPKALIQFEDFANRNALRLLERYRGRVCCFNDDIQGTAAVALAGLYSAGRITGRRLRDEKILFHGAGGAAIGIGNLIVAAMTAQGLEKKDAMARCWFMDSKALVESGRADLGDYKKPYAHAHKPVGDLLSAVRELEPTVLIGVSGKAGQFTREVVAEMSRINERPVIFALSNPTANSECTAEEAYRWSGDKALFAGGSPFAPVEREGKRLVPGQGNNVYIFPGVGMGVVVSGAKRMTDEMFMEAARILARSVTDDELREGCLYPSLGRIREVSALIAAATAEIAYQRGLAAEPRPRDLAAAVESRQYKPEYPKYA
ncbi:MAG TPA: NAD-dependent malic enzyme [Elusimicrobiota bacterium]|nr:NAD-dependent malic enzyme [Elusimicrobiota bacterium]